MLASFEKTTDHLVSWSLAVCCGRHLINALAAAKQFDAALYSKEDAIEGVSECIIMGNPAANCGTSMSVRRILRQVAKSLTLSVSQGLIGCRSTGPPPTETSSLRERIQARSGEGKQGLTPPEMLTLSRYPLRHDLFLIKGARLII